MSDDILNRYVCTAPFTYLEAHNDGVYSCCPSWLPKKLSNLIDIESVWGGDNLSEIQSSILDGSYKFCSKDKCPYLSKLLREKVPPKGFIDKDSFDVKRYTKGPIQINFAFDRSCNLSCPSCRNSVIMANKDEITHIDTQIRKISNTFGKTLNVLYLSGTADPLASKSIRKFLFNFDKTNFPKVNNIHLHTNGLLLNKETWSKLTHIHQLIKGIEISIDASKKETYEIVRRGGDWNTLINNLNFISKNVKSKIRVSFVVQDTNYLEMYDFYNLMMEIFKSKVEVFYNKISNWGTFTEEEFNNKKIWDENHPNFNNFLSELIKIDKKFSCIHNMHDISQKYFNNKPNKLF